MFEPYVQLNNANSPNEKLVEALSIKKAKPKEYFNLYCQSGKQKRALKTKIKAVLPKAPSGMMLDEAAKFDKTVHDKADAIVSNYYLIGHGSKYETKQEIQPINYKINRTLAKTAHFSASSFKTFDQHVKYFKSPLDARQSANPVELDSDDRDSEGDVECGGKCPPVRACPVVVSFSERGKPILLGFKHLLGAKIENSGGTDLYDKPERKNIHVDIQEPDCGFIGEVDTKGLKSTNMQTVYPIKPLVPFEPRFFSSSFTMLMPLKVQRTVWANGSKEKLKNLPNYATASEEQRANAFREIDQKINDWQGFFVNEDGTFNISDAVKERSDLWQEYIQTFTNVKRSQSADPQIIDYEVSLDLNVFCAYGRPISDFITK